MGQTGLSGQHVVVAGAGLAGLSAARELEAGGADVTVVEARGRVGGRVHTLRDGFGPRRHAEAGADLIEGEQSLVRELARSLRLDTVRVLRRGFGYYGPDGRGRRRMHRGPATFERAARLLKREIADYRLADQRWDSGVALALARQSVAEWLRRIHADRSLSAGLRGLRGFFLADPEDLSLIAVVDQFASGGAPGDDEIFRISGGNSRLPEAMARRLKKPVSTGTVLRRIRQTGQGVVAKLESTGTIVEIRADFLVLALPASTAQDVIFEPALPEAQQRAFAALRYGCATRVLLQFERPFWRRRSRPAAFGTDLPTGAVWDAAEEQRGAAILSLLAGGHASRELQAILAAEGEPGIVNRLSWLGRPAPLRVMRTVTWEDDPWSRGGYAYFDPAFDPSLRAWLARPAGRVVFAGEHTSARWQGFMNGAIESGRRAAAELRALASY